MNLAKALDVMEKLETQLASVYRHLSELLSNDPEVSELFSELALDEDSHRLAVRYQQRLVRMNSKGFNDIELDLAALEELARMIERVQAAQTMSAFEALKFARHVEIAAGEHHLKNALSFNNPEMTDLLRSLGNGDTQHISKIASLLTKRSQ